MQAEVIKIVPEDSPSYNATQYSKAIEKAAKVLQSGGLVAFPTETVYGLGVNADMPQSVERLTRVKNSPDTRPFTYHISNIDAIYNYVSKIPRLAQRLIRAYWPGPLTLVLPTTDKDYIGIRLPDHRVARDIIRLAGVRVIAPSANLAGSPPHRTADEVIKSLGDRVDIIVDAGPCRYGISSTVVKIDDNSRFEILREGAIAAKDIQKFSYKMILFVCSGNTCRSAMAVGLYKKILADKLHIPVDELESKGYKIISAGTSAIYNSPASNLAVTALKELSADISRHRSQPVTMTLIEESDQIYVMTKGHLTTLKEWIPQATDRMTLLDPTGEDIEDPIGGELETYRLCRDKIHKGLERLL
ncbi:MAG: threonylcarbamoyl-AMP synthase [Planctomycetes bacterium]|nr:threonylcarbamoyl-AMP synthase [Planctomycetota bacterium]